MPRFSRVRLWTVFVLALIVCALITVVRHRFERTGGNDPLTSITRRVLFSPFLHVSNSFGKWWRDDIGSIFHGPRLAAQNRRLRAQVAALMQEDRALSDQAAENIQLRALLNFKAHDTRPLLPAEVLALKPFSERDSAIFSRGSDNSVSVKEPALDEDGNLVGQVTAVSSNTCDVMLLTDSLSSVGARVINARPAALAASTAPVGICVGDHSNLLELTDLAPDVDVQVGDTVVTSGLGGVYPKDIPIGRIVNVDFDKTRYLKTAQVAPWADFNHLQDGFLLR